MGSGGDDAAPPSPRATRRPRCRSPQATTEARQLAAVDRLPLTRQVGRLVVLRFAGTSAPGYVRDVLREGRAAGAILFRDNLTGRGPGARAHRAAAARAPPRRR